MPKQTPDRPEKLKPYFFHGIDLQWRDGDKEAIARCPFCSRDKFSVNIEEGLCRCLVCNMELESKDGGNIYTFIRKLWEVCDKATTIQDYQELADDRGLLDPLTVMNWGICKSIITGEWLMPGYNHEGKLTQLYRYHGKILKATSTLPHAIHGRNLYNPETRTIDITEGLWDGMALWEMFSKVRRTKTNEFVETNSSKKCMLNERSVLAVPGCNTWQDAWSNMCKDKVVNLWYDNDHPRKVGTRDIKPAGLSGMKRVAGKIGTGPGKALEINFLKWGDEGGGWSLDHPSGMDVRDYLALEV